MLKYELKWRAIIIIIEKKAPLRIFNVQDLFKLHGPPRPKTTKTQLEAGETNQWRNVGGDDGDKRTNEKTLTIRGKRADPWERGEAVRATKCFSTNESKEGLSFFASSDNR